MGSDRHRPCQSSESGSDNPTEGDKVVSKNFKWDEDNHRLRYTVIINPDDKGLSA